MATCWTSKQGTFVSIWLCLWARLPFIYQQDVSCLPWVSLAAKLGESCPAHMAAGTISSLWPIGYLHGGWLALPEQPGKAPTVYRRGYVWFRAGVDYTYRSCVMLDTYSWGGTQRATLGVPKA